MNAPARARAYRFGLRAETVCVWWLRAQGYRVLARRFNAAVGEIDIIARRGGLVAMIEVKARSGGDMAQAIPSQRQRRRITRAAEVFTPSRGLRYTIRSDDRAALALAETYSRRLAALSAISAPDTPLIPSDLPYVGLRPRPCYYLFPMPVISRDGA